MLLANSPDWVGAPSRVSYTVCRVEEHALVVGIAIAASNKREGRKDKGLHSQGSEVEKNCTAD